MSDTHGPDVHETDHDLVAAEYVLGTLDAGER